MATSLSAGGRIANTTLQMPADLPVVGYGMSNAFGDVSFDSPVVIASPPGETNRLFVGEKGGHVYVITNLAAPTKTEFLDATADLINHGEGGFLGLAFHPGYATNGYIYVYRTVGDSLDGVHRDFYDEVARFSVDPADPNRALPDSKLRLIAQYDQNPDEHNAGDLHFGPDGYLYISVGDNGPAADEPTGDPQPLDRHFFASILRIDVDQRPGNLAPNPYGGVAANYLVPRDNPFIGVTKHNGFAVDPSRIRTELYAIGLRNPWRMSFDPESGTLYCGDVGNQYIEEVNVISAGGNYGWPYLQGPGVQMPLPSGFRPTAPLYFYSHGASRLWQGNCIIGGVVYHGDGIPQLQGAYVFGDFLAGRVWALRHQGTNVTSLESLAQVPSLTAFGIDPGNGDVLAASIDGRIRRLIYAPPTANFPQTLADTGVFSDLFSLTPQPGIIPYDVSVSFWSDNAIKRRWFCLPDPESQIVVNGATNWAFPPGSVWIKHFELELTNGLANSRRRIETRLIVKTASAAYGVTYRWGGLVTNALLVPEGGMEESFVIRGNGLTRTQLWVYPSRGDCMRCHNAGAGRVLGFNSAQMNCTVVSDGAPTNQVSLLGALGYLRTDSVAPNDLPRLAHPTNSVAPIELRFRSYLQANCAPCHYPGGPPGTAWDARITTPMHLANILNSPALTQPGASIIKPGDPTNSFLFYRLSHQERRMPPLASTVLDSNAVALVSDYVRGLPVDLWAAEDIGITQMDGSSSILDGTCRVTGTGTGLDAVSDSFHYLFRKLAGNGQIIARLMSVDSLGGLAGIMIRDGRSPNSPYWSVFQQGGGDIRFQSRADGGAVAGACAPGSRDWSWFRLAREADNVHAYCSTNGVDWTQIGAPAAAGTNDLLAGLMASSSGAADGATATFTQVSTMTIRFNELPVARTAAVFEPIPLSASVTAWGRAVRSVEFYDGSQLIGTAVASPYSVTWSNASAGDRVLRARAIDSGGADVFSDVVHFQRTFPDTRLSRPTSDSTSQGGWRARYGSAGSIIAGDSTNLSGRVRFAFNSHQGITWARTSTQKRALQRAGSKKRIGAGWVSSTNLTVDLAFDDGLLHRVSFYFVDWQGWPRRSELVELFDSDTGRLLISRTISKFAGGMYLSYVVRGSIMLRVTRIAGPSATLSGIFVDPADDPPPSVSITAPDKGSHSRLFDPVTIEASAHDADGTVDNVHFFSNGEDLGSVSNSPYRLTWRPMAPGTYTLAARAVDELGVASWSDPVTITVDLPPALADVQRVDNDTFGFWYGTYGEDGFGIPLYATNYPVYAQVNLGSAQTYSVWSSSEARELRWPGSDDTRQFSSWYNNPTLTVDIRLVDGNTHQFAAYFVDPENSRSERIALLDGDTQQTLDTIDLPSFSAGQYYVWNVRGHVQLRVTLLRGQSAILNGLFFDSLAAAAAPVRGQVRATISSDAGIPRISFLRPPADATPFVVEASDDLVTWRALRDEAIEVSIEETGDMDRVTIRLMTPLSSSARRFFRIGVAAR